MKMFVRRLCGMIDAFYVLIDIPMPGSVEATSITSNSFSVTWIFDKLPACYQTDSYYFLLEYSTVQTKIIASETQSFYTHSVSRLLPNTPYNISLQVILGSEIKSDPVHYMATTLSSAMPKPPGTALKYGNFKYVFTISTTFTKWLTSSIGPFLHFSSELAITCELLLTHTSL